MKKKKIYKRSFALEEKLFTTNEASTYKQEQNSLYRLFDEVLQVVKSASQFKDVSKAIRILNEADSKHVDTIYGYKVATSKDNSLQVVINALENDREAVILSYFFYKDQPSRVRIDIDYTKGSAFMQEEKVWLSDPSLPEFIARWGILNE